MRSIGRSSGTASGGNRRPRSRLAFGRPSTGTGRTSGGGALSGKARSATTTKSSTAADVSPGRGVSESSQHEPEMPGRLPAAAGNRHKTQRLNLKLFAPYSFHVRPHQVLNSAQSLEHLSPREPDAGRETETRTRRPARPRGAGEAGAAFQEERRRERGAEGSAGAKET